MTIEQILEIVEKYKLRMPPTAFYELKADIVNFEDMQTTKNNLGVDREDAVERLNALKQLIGYDKDSEIVKATQKSLDMAIKALEQEPKTGHWVKTPKAVMGEGYMWYCDKCEHQVYQDSSRDYPSEKYCPNCGAKMVEPQESEAEDGNDNRNSVTLHEVSE